MIKPDFNLIPTDLKKLHQWVIWKGAKVPYIACLPHRKANVTNPSTWSTFDDAKIAYFSGRFDGVRFVLNGNGNVTIAASKNVQYKMQYSSGKSMEISTESNTVTNRKKIQTDELVFNKHKLNQQFHQQLRIHRFQYHQQHLFYQVGFLQQHQHR